jgi:hypothetical protein
MIRHKACILPALTLLIAFSGVTADLSGKVFFSGGSQSLFYYRENISGQTGQSSVDNFRFYESVRMKLVGKGKKNSLGFHTFFLTSKDFNVDYDQDPLNRLYNGYLEWKTGRFSTAVGRQWLHLGAGSLTLDGAKVRYANPRYLEFTGYLGTESPYSRHFNLTGWDRARAGGVFVSTKALKPVKLGIGFHQKDRAGQVALREMGLNGKAALSNGLRLTGRLDLDLLDDRVQKGIFRLRYQGLEKWQFLAEYKHYQPRLFYQSYFRRFDPKANNQMRGGATYYLRPEVTVTGTFNAIFFEDEKNCYLSLGLACPYGSATFYHGDGFGGDECGFAAGASYPVCEKFELYADIDYSRYRFYEDEDRDYLFSSIFGFNWRPKKNIMAGLELQDVNNDVLSKDWRLMLKFSLNHRQVF